MAESESRISKLLWGTATSMLAAGLLWLLGHSVPVFTAFLRGGDIEGVIMVALELGAAISCFRDSRSPKSSDQSMDESAGVFFAGLAVAVFGYFAFKGW